LANKFFTIQPNLSEPVRALKSMSGLFCVGVRQTHVVYPRAGVEMCRPIKKKEYKQMYKLYVLKKKKKVLKKTTKSYSNLQAFLYALRKRGYVCLVEYPGRKS